MKFSVQKIGKLITDQPAWQLPPDAITTANNVRVNDYQLGTIGGHSQFFQGTAAPYFVMPITDGSTYYWLYMGLDDGYIYNGTASTNITRAAGVYTGSATDRWNGCIINGVPVVNNGVDDPQMFAPISTATDLILLTAWDTNWKAKVIRQYKNFLVALNVTKSSVVNAHMIKWSDIADSGTVPSSWDETSASTLAGETYLSETDGILIDAVQLRDELIIYKEDSVYGMQFIGGVNVFRFRRIRGLGGILAQQCAVEFDRGHFVVGGATSRDIYIHDGQSSVSIAEDIVRDAFFSDLDSDNYASTFVVPHYTKKEIWICYPSSGSSLPDKALIWNYLKDQWTFTELPANTTHGDSGVVDITAYTWATLPYTTWDEWTGIWNERQFSPVTDTLVMASTDTWTYKFEDGNQFDGVNAKCTIERIGLDIGDSSDYHMVTAIYPYIEGSSVNVYIGSQASQNASVTWEGPYVFDPSTDYKVNVRRSGRLHAIRFESEANVQWALSGYGLEYQDSGKR